MYHEIMNAENLRIALCDFGYMFYELRVRSLAKERSYRFLYEPPSVPEYERSYAKTDPAVQLPAEYHLEKSSYENCSPASIADGFSIFSTLERTS